MAEHPHDRDRVTEREHTSTTHVTTEKSSTSGIAFIVGGLVVAVLLIFWLFSGSDVETGPEVSETNVTVEETETVGSGTEGEAEPAVEAPAPATEGAEETQATEEPAAEEAEPETAN